MKSKFFGVIFFILTAVSGFAQTGDPESVMLPANKNYTAGWFHKLFFGEHWRELWAAEVEAEILDVKTFAGGMKPIEKGGGLQTKSLRFLGRDGVVYKFRSLLKDPSKILPEELRESLVTDVLEDQISSAHPYAPFIVTPFMNALGIMNAPPALVFLPDSDALGEFRGEFGGLLGTIEIHPDAEPDLDREFMNAEKVSGTMKLLNRLQKKYDEKTDSREFLKARLLDIFVGDWDRHSDQWRWAKYKNGTNEIWKPIPRDRDQAFAKFGGLLPAIAAYVTPQLVHFSEDYPNVKYAAWSGRFLDRRFLPELSKHEWDSVTSFIYEKLTDSLIEKAARNQPEVASLLSSDELITKLKKRKERFREMSAEYFSLINSVSDVYCKDDDDLALINRLPDGKTEVAVYRKNKKINDPPFFKRIFDDRYTTEIRVYLGDGDDLAIINGNTGDGPLIRIIGGKGKDELIDSSEVYREFLPFVPFKYAAQKNGFYDNSRSSTVAGGSSTYTDFSKWEEGKTDEEKFEPGLRDRGSELLFFPSAELNSNDGLIAGAGFNFEKYDFRADPNLYEISFIAAYATRPNNYRLKLNGKFNRVFSFADLIIDVQRTKLMFTNYFGYGNNTGFDTELDEKDFYKLEQELHLLNIGLSARLWKNIGFRFGVTHHYSEIKLNTPSNLDGFKYGTFGKGNTQLIALDADITTDGRDNRDFPMNGYYLSLKGDYSPPFFNIEKQFARAGFDLRKYFPLGFLDGAAFAFRVSGGKNWGPFPFFKAQFMGGYNSLRGYNRERFSGDAMIFGQTELRLNIGDIKFIVKGKLGMQLFAETGRIFVYGEKSDRWHPSYGFGISYSILKREFNIALITAFSPENFHMYLTTKLSF